MGYSVRWPRWRCTVWLRYTATPQPHPDWTNIVGRELYDHRRDPGEDENVAGEDSNREIMDYCVMDLIKYSWRHLKTG